jgi:hypothetical protein
MTHSRSLIAEAEPMPEPTLDPGRMLAAKGSRPSTLQQLEDQLTFLGSSCHTVPRWTRLTKGQLLRSWDGLTREDIRGLAARLHGRIKIHRGAAQIRWTLISDVLASIYDDDAPARGGESNTAG